MIPKDLWIAVYAEVRPSPLAWLESIDCDCAEYLMTIIRTVMSYAVPPRYPASNIWKLMHNDPDVNMSGFYEARRRCDDDLFRLICHFDHPPAPAPSKPVPAKRLVLLHGYSKPDRSPARVRELNQAIGNWNQYAQTRKASPAIRFPADFCP